MNTEVFILISTATSIAAVHTFVGPDHYLPFIVLAKSKNWSLFKTLNITFICGLGHLSSSILLVFLGATFGWSMAKVFHLESVRGGLAAWLWLILGLLYTIWAISKMINNKTHKHFETTEDGEVYIYQHNHDQKIVLQKNKFKINTWVLFIVFVLGPCEPLIPLLSYSGSQNSWNHLLITVASFSITTIIAMFTAVTLGYLGYQMFASPWLEKNSHIIAGITIFISGLGMLVLGW